MEGILLDVESYGSVFSFFGGLALLVAVFAGLLLGHAYDVEKRGTGVHWTAEPVPGTEEAPTAGIGEIRKAA